MNWELEQDLWRWETGQIGLSELEARHPGADVAALIELRARLLAAGGAPPLTSLPAWETLRSRLPDRRSTLHRMRRRARRSVAVALVAGVLAIPAISHARDWDLRARLDRIVKDLVGNDAPGPPAPAPQSSPGPDEGTVEVPDRRGGGPAVQTTRSPQEGREEAGDDQDEAEREGTGGGGRGDGSDEAERDGAGDRDDDEVRGGDRRGTRNERVDDEGRESRESDGDERDDDRSDDEEDEG